jgi:ABC-2 type transport system permease protein
MKKYLTQMKLNIQRHLIYRARIVIWVISDLSQYAIMPFLWLALYGSSDDIGGYTRQGIVSYYIIAAFVQAATTSHIGQYLADDIRTGNFTKDLVRPINGILTRFFGEMSYRFMATVISSFVLLGIFLMVPRYFPSLPPVLSLVFFLFSLFGAISLSFLLEVILGLSAFWLGESSTLFRIRWFLEKILSGGIAPLTLLPVFLKSFALASPFQYLSYFPIQIYLQKFDTETILTHFLILGGWIVLCVFITILLWKKGLKRYEGGGI